MLWCGVFLAAVTLSTTVGAQSNPPSPEPPQGSDSSQACPNNRILSDKLISDICWSCLFPIKMGPVELGGGNVPDGASEDVFCACPDNNGVPRFGNVIGMWEPAYLIDVIRAPGCSPSLQGVVLPGVNDSLWGNRGYGSRDGADKGFHNYHYYAFPLIQMLDLYTPGQCNASGIVDFDLLHPSEMDPTWNDEELAFFTNPEAAAVANIPAIMACTASSAGTAAGIVTDELWWCAGSWGNLYPFSGHGNADGMPRMTSLSAMRAVAAQHRRGLMRRTMGSEAQCEATIEPMLPKSQYRMSMFFPVAETDGNHVMGETTFNWGRGHTIPRTGEDATYMLWRWRDCCNVQL
jgi:conjugal transfer pilus assembly protein TraU